MLDSVHDSCGVAAVYMMGHWPGGSDPSLIPEEDNASRLIPAMLTYLQNRGQLAAGLTSYHPGRDQLLDTYKDNGSVAEVFRFANKWKRDSLMMEYAGRAAIGHVRYATCGRDDPAYAQPFERHHGRRWKWFSFGFNGNIANYSQCRDQFLSLGDYHLVRETDTEIIMHHFSLALAGDEKPDFVRVFQHFSRTFDGAYSLVFLNADGDLVVARDPHGFRPLCYGVEGKLFAAASESLPLQEMGFSDIRDVEPGTFVHVRRDGWQVERFAEARRSYCFFEWVYFSNVASVLNGKSVYLSRRNTGEELARIETQKIDGDCIVVPVPDTARAAADAMAQKLGVPCIEGLMRNRYVGRTFIEGHDRAQKARGKYTVIPEVLQGKRVFLVEDSIVRSTTLRVIISLLRDRGGAREVHVRVACPPIMAPCSYGIDMSTVGELFAPKHLEGPCEERLADSAERRLAENLAADSICYLPVDALARCIDLPRNELCMGCLTGEYPTEWGRKLYSLSLEEVDAGEANGEGKGGHRTYEKVKRGG